MAIPPGRAFQCFKDGALTLAILAFSTSTLGWINADGQIAALTKQKDEVELLLVTCMSGGALAERESKTIYMCDKVVELQPFPTFK